MINKERLINTFMEYVRIDSETLNEKDMADRLERDLTELGYRVYSDNAGANFGSNGRNVYCYLDGDESYDPIMISAHIDTVKPGIGIEPIIEDGYIRSKGNTILGSDDKAGVAAIVEALKLAKEQNLKCRPIEAIFSIAEEGGLRGAKNLEFDKIKSKKAIILDSSGDVGHIIVGAPGQTKITAEIIGKPAHAGIAPENGISAISVMSEAITNMKLLRVDEETTANIGTFKAESATNIVCEKAVMIAEARSRSNDKLEAQTNHMVKCLQNACDKYGAKLNCNIEQMYLSYKVEENDEFLKFVQDKCRELNIIPSNHTSGGGSDSNVYNAKGMKAIVLGIGMEKVHTTDEQIAIEQLEKLADLTLKIMMI